MNDGDQTGNITMLNAARKIFDVDTDVLVRDALGLAGLCVAILATLFLPLFA
jgi:hypothetical protein